MQWSQVAKMQEYEEAEDTDGAQFPICYNNNKNFIFWSLLERVVCCLLFAYLPSGCSDSLPPLQGWQSSERTGNVVKQWGVLHNTSHCTLALYTTHITLYTVHWRLQNVKCTLYINFFKKVPWYWNLLSSIAQSIHQENWLVCDLA